MRNRAILIASTLAALALVGCEQPDTIERAERYAGQEEAGEEVVVTEGEQPMEAEDQLAPTEMTAGEVKFTQSTGPVMWRAQDLGVQPTDSAPELDEVLGDVGDTVADLDVNDAMQQLQQQEGQPEPSSWHEVKGQLTLELVNVREMQDQQMGQQRMQGQQVGQQPSGEGMDQDQMQGQQMDQEQMARDQQPMGKEELAQQPGQDQDMQPDQAQQQREQQMQERQQMAQQMQTQDRIQLTAVMTDDQGNEVRIEPQRPVVPPMSDLSQLDGAFSEFGQGDEATYSGWFLGNVVVNGQTTDQQRLMYVSARPLMAGADTLRQGAQELGQEAEQLGQEMEQMGEEAMGAGEEPVVADRTEGAGDQEQQYAVHVVVLPVEMSGNTPEMSNLQSLDELAMTGTTEAGEGEAPQQGTQMGASKLQGALHIVYAGAQKVEEPTAAKPAG